jgi:copper chaperone CopZ
MSGCSLHSVIVAFILGIIAALCLPTVLAAPPAGIGTPRELGRVKWGHDLDKALATSKQTGKPVLLLFQEIPGCQGCINFGDQPLSHPLIAEAIEDLFVPVAIHNNKPGYDAAILKRFDEPASNFPVMRFLDAAGKDIVERRENIFTAHDVSKRLIEALATAGRDVPPYLQLAMVESDTSRDHREWLTFAMHCFWEGQAGLGAIDGVVTTRASYYENQETVDVAFDPTIVSIEDLVKAADAGHCADTVYVHGDVPLVHARSALNERAKPAKATPKAAPASDQNYWIAQSSMRFLPLTPMQAMKVNSAVHLNQDAKRWLSPRQVALLAMIEAALQRNPKALDGLTRPDSIDGLPKYEDQLATRLK